ncbi:tetratricopeptide repeat protein [Sphingosinicella rhizophila]|uniref:Tetratricopeptide repeat protein n=1 Tax=Sphingosinicella rhizophila TaxID=3050082 RepID=A0ABU3Q675_9SPHN|nr:hypothetical protein [Sphingosinicella sp. GR2756]MDT9598906.1 hypothetical protein [Sphingosinicella sp. GR2756]
MTGSGPFPAGLRPIGFGLGILVVALAAIYFILRNVAIGLLASTAPPLALKFPPPSGVALANSILLETRRQPDMAVKEKLRRALARAPLSDAPMVAAAWHARQAGRLPQASHYMDLAKERNRPGTSRQVLSLMVNIQQGRWGDAIDQIKKLGGRKDTAPVMAKILLLLAQHPEAKKVLIAKLGEDPAWRSRFLREAKKNGADPALLAELKGDES